MNNKDIFDILHSEFDDCPNLPDSLSKRNVVEKLKGVTQDKHKTLSIKKIASIAAAVVVVAVCAVLATTDFREDLSIENNDVVMTTQQANIIAPTVNENAKPQGETALLQAKSREEIVEKFFSAYDENGYRFGMATDADNLKGATGASSAASAMDSFVNESYSESADDKSYAETNTQTQGVDEGDIIKTDSRYIYMIGSDSGRGNKKLRITDTETMTAVYDGYIYDEKGDILWVNDLYVSGNVLVAVCGYQNYDFGCIRYDSYYPSSGATVTVSYDITDRANPKLIKRNTQDGSYASSRMVGNILYTVSQYYVYAEEKEELENNCIPKVGGVEIACDCIYMPEDMGESYICLTAYDVTQSDGKVSAVAVLGSTGNYYCSEDNFYIIADRYYYSDEYKDKDSNSYSIINAFSLDGLNISYEAAGEVKGRVLNQYSLDEYDGNLRIATTYYNNKTQKNESSVYVLNEKLDVIGSLEDIAKDEQIKSVRYMGEKAYIVTFKNTDPLFAIDLSDSKNPKVLGELKLPGYSAYLHPVSENLLIGVGYDGDSQNADFDTIKISLFDIADSNNLKELDSLTFKNISTSVIYNPKAFLYKADEGIIGFPADNYDNDSGGMEYVYYLVELKDNKLSLKHKLLHESGYYISADNFRGTYIGDNFFTVSDYIVKKFDFNSGEEKGECLFADKQSLVATTAVNEGASTDDYAVTPTISATTASSTKTSQGYTVEEPKTAADSGAGTVTAPPYNPNNPAEVTENPQETKIYQEPTTVED